MKYVLIVFLVVILIIVLLGFYRTYKSEHSRNATTFREGTLPTQPLDGDYTGRVTGYKGAWQGKTFSASNQQGINNFGPEQKYPFRTTTGPGVRENETEVVKIIYNLKGNPFWIKPVLDEVVEIAPNHYLGKLHYRLIPGFPFTIGYFHLEK